MDIRELFVCEQPIGNGYYRWSDFKSFADDSVSGIFNNDSSETVRSGCSFGSDGTLNNHVTIVISEGYTGWEGIDRGTVQKRLGDCYRC